MIEFKSGVLPSPKSPKDFISTAIIPTDGISLEPVFSWQDKDVIDINQKQFGTCVGCTGAGIKNVHEYVEGDFVQGGFSPLFLYTMCKQLDGIPNVEGTYPSIAMEILRTVGIVPENDMPYYNLRNINSLPQINDELKAKAAKYKISTYAKIPKDITAIKQALKVSPAMMAMMVYNNFVNNTSGYINKPSGPFLGGHAIKLIGWNDKLVKNGYEGYFIFKNTWGKYWGNNGYGYIPYELISLNYDGSEFVYELWSCVDEIVNNPKKKYFKVQTGAFKNKNYAQRRIEELKLKGFPTYLPIPGSDGLYRIQVGAFEKEAGALITKAELIKAGYLDVFIVYQ